MYAAARDFIRENVNLPPINMPKLGFSEAIDILIVACLLYLIMRWIRKTRAWPLLKGVVIICLVALAAWLFDLVTVLWVLQNAFAWGLVVIVILFQPELRKALEQIGRGRLPFNFTTKTGENAQKARFSPHTVNEIVKACKAMAAVKTGALIVMEEAVELSEQERTGVLIDARVTSQLLLNIFEKNTPLHDGAVILRHNRVAAAACILPLTSESFGHELGTRHRAAIGISEASDALVCVVSEETGVISVVLGGIIERGLSEYQLRDILMKRELTAENGGHRFSLFRNRRGSGGLDDMRR